MQTMEEIVEQLRILKEVQQAFIDDKDWLEVSKVQFDIDELHLAKARAMQPRIELWFRVAFMQWWFDRLQALINKDIYVLKTLLRVKGEE